MRNAIGAKGTTHPALVLHLRAVCGEYGRPLDDLRRAAVV